MHGRIPVFPDSVLDSAHAPEGMSLFAITTAVVSVAVS